MRKLIMFIHCLVAIVAMVSCEKEPYQAADIEYERVLRVFDRDYKDANGLHGQTPDQKAIMELAPLYNLYFCLERPQIICYSGIDYSGCTVETIKNFVDDSREGEYYSVIFDRVIYTDVMDVVLTYKIFYYTDRSVQKEEAYDEDGYLITGSDGSPLYTESYLEANLTIVDQEGNVLVDNDDIQVLKEVRAVD